MGRKYNLYQIDSFTKERFTGNPAGVITNADGLDEVQMQRIARELNNSETAFVFSGNQGKYDVHVRFFTPSNEVPICGHATIAAHYARALELNLDTTRVYHKTGAGILPVDIVKKDNDYKIIMTQGKVEFGDVINGDYKARLLKALGLEKEDLMENHPIQIVSTGHSKVMIAIKNKDKLNSLAPDNEGLKNLSRDISCNGYYVFTMADEKEDVLVHGRMFAPAIGIEEDPVTGNANGPLGAYLVKYNFVPSNGEKYTFRAMQGEAIHRTGTVEVEVKIEAGTPVEIKVSGNAVVVFKTQLIY